METSGLLDVLAAADNLAEHPHPLHVRVPEEYEVLFQVCNPLTPLVHVQVPPP